MENAMLKASRSDSDKLAIVVKKIVSDSAAQNRDKVLVRTKDLYSACHFSNLRRVYFCEEVQDFLTTTEFAMLEAGCWVFTEFGDGYSMFIQVAPVGVSPTVKGLLEVQKIHEYVFPA